VADTLVQSGRRLGQVLYFTDLGRSGMSCDSCHLEGHTEGVFFEKTHPMRIYRATTVRGSKETPPYFTPASTFSLAQTSQIVGGRNRFHNDDLTEDEVRMLTLFSETLTLLPNPFLNPDGTYAQELELPDGARGNPARGLALFEGAAQCSGCHPAPHFTTDQDVRTRGHYMNVGTPRALPLRLELQEAANEDFAPASLLGAWDIFPMLTSGAAGLKVGSGGCLEVETRFPLRAVVDVYNKPPHGNAFTLTAEQRNDLLAYLLSL
jgi:cytochrome c peroxidase